MDRNEDLTKVFDRRWKANHNDDVQRAREKEKKFMNKMFGGNTAITGKNKIVTPQDRLNNLQNNMNAANEAQKSMRVNSILNKWK